MSIEQNYFTYLGEINKESFNKILSKIKKLNTKEKNIEILDSKNKLYNKFLNDYEEVGYEKNHKTMLIQVPFSIIEDFIKILYSKIIDKDSKFSKIKIKIVILNKSSINNFADNFNILQKIYNDFFKEIKKVDKFIEIYDFGDELELYGSSSKNRENIKKVFSNYQDKLIPFIARKPRLKTYFPSKDQAKLENMSLKEFYRVFLGACSLDWNRMKEAQEELVNLFRKYDKVKIKGKNADISFGIKGLGAKNSIIDSNYPGSETFGAPEKTKVNGWIYYPNPCYFKYTSDTLYGVYFEFKNGKLMNFELRDKKYSNKIKIELEQKIKKYFKEKDGNTYLGELAFGTNFFIKPGIKNKLLGEKAIGMHIALGKSYNYAEVDNGNFDATIHWDAIRAMDDGSTVIFKKKSGKEIEIMNDGNFNNQYLPKLSKYQQEVNNNK